VRLLLVEDDAMIGAGIRTGLRQEDFVVDWVQDGCAAELALACEVYAAVLLDLGLPRKDGFAVLEGLRRRKNRVPVLILTARDAVADRVRGLNEGADDYLVKPFDLNELAARIRAVLRRQAGRAEPRVTFGELTLDPSARKVTHRGKEVPVSAREFALLEALMHRPGVALSRAKLEEHIYGWGEEVASNSVEVHIHNLRKKLGDATIRTVRGAGYAIANDGDAACRSAENSS
jgi:two-component system, OmpR family, response regulator